MSTVTQIIQRMIDDIAANPDMNQLGTTRLYGLRALQAMPIGERVAASLKRQDIIEFIKWRRKDVCAATALQTLSMLRGAFKHASATWDDCENLADVVVAIGAALPYLQKHNLIAKSTPRTRRPSDDEITALLNYYREPRRAHRSKIRMPEIIAFALVSSRRISEICRITWGDVDFDNACYWVRDLKHPTKKKGNDKQFILFPELATIIKRQPRHGMDPSERVFPFNSKSCSASYTVAKKALGIEGLRFHDNRGEAISRWLLEMGAEDVRVAVSGHDNTKILERVYDRRSSLDIVKKKHAHLLTQA
jgi:integrase